MALVGGSHTCPISFHLENIPNKKTKPLQQSLTDLENPCKLVSVVPQYLKILLSLDKNEVTGKIILLQQETFLINNTSRSNNRS